MIILNIYIYLRVRLSRRTYPLLPAESARTAYYTHGIAPSVANTWSLTLSTRDAATAAAVAATLSLQGLFSHRRRRCDDRLRVHRLVQIARTNLCVHTVYTYIYII